MSGYGPSRKTTINEAKKYRNNPLGNDEEKELLSSRSNSNRMHNNLNRNNQNNHNNYNDESSHTSSDEENEWKFV